MLALPRIFPVFLILAAGNLLTACTTAPVASESPPSASVADAATAETATTKTEQDDDNVVPSTWTADTLYDLLLGEVAGQRDDVDAALNAYLRQTQQLRDPLLAERAARIAWYSRDSARIRKATLLWVDLAPDDPDANANAVMGLIQAGDIEAAGPMLDKLLANTQVRIRFSVILQYAQVSDAAVRARLAVFLEEHAKRYPQHAALALARAQLADMRGQSAEALLLVQQSRVIEPDVAEAIELEGRLLAASGENRRALKLLARGSKRFPADRDLRLTHLRLLLENNQADRARDELTSMRARWPDDGDLTMSLALVEWETGHADRAKALLVELADTGYREDDAWNYAGRVAMSESKFDEAISYFQNVRGPQFLTAQIQIAYALQQTNRLPEARRLLTALRAQAPEAATQLSVAESDLLARSGDAAGALALINNELDKSPIDPDLRYARAMAAERVGQLELVESDLRSLLVEHPRNAMVLNALGYTLADRTDRYDEALQLIERALSLSPEDPAILDSMGWVLFRLGRAEEAENYLRRAWALSQDAEIAAHLAEVLWKLGKKHEARALLKRAAAKEPDHAVLKATIHRLSP